MSRVRQRRGRGKRRLAVFLVLLSAGALLGGFVAFANHVDAQPRAGRTVEAAVQARLAARPADGIAVWTGKGGGRLETAGALLEAGHGERLLVSGVNPSLSADTVAELSQLPPALAQCCLDIDYRAQDTRGNALETAMWAEALGYGTIALVTSAYHMPRARLELGHARPELTVVPVAVQDPDAGAWWRSGARFRRLSGEYGKYLLSLARGRSGARGALPEATPPLPNDTRAEPVPPG